MDGSATCIIGCEPFSNLDFADDVALFGEMFEVLLLALEIMEQEAKPFDLEINWNKTSDNLRSATCNHHECTSK